MKLPLLFATALLISGCGTFADPTEWFDDEGPKHAELVDFEARLAPVTRWSRDIGSGAEEKQLGLRPVIGGDRIYAAEYGGQVVALDVDTGRQVWEQDLDLSLTGGPGVGDGLVIVGTEEALVVALDSETGEERWRARVSSEVLAPPAMGLGVVVVHTIDGNLIGIDARDGAELWRYGHRVPTLTLRGSGAPIVSGATVICGLAGGKLVAIQIDNGQLVWDIQVTVPGGRSELERLADIDGDPLVVGGVIYVTTYQGDVAAIGEASGRVLWRRPLSAYAGLSNDWLQVYLADAEGRVWALDPDTGAARWRQEALWGRRLSAPAVLDQYIVVGDFEGYLHWLSQEDGSFVARTRVGSSPIHTAPLVNEGVLYVYGSDGDLDAITLPEPDSER